MDWTSILVALIPAVGAFLGVYLSNRKSSALMEYRIGQLESKMDHYNHIQERVHNLEENVAVHSEQIKVANHRIEDLEKRGA